MGKKKKKPQRGLQPKRQIHELSCNSTLKINVNGAMTCNSGGGGANGVSSAARMNRLKHPEHLGHLRWCVWSNANKVENIKLFRRHRAATSNQRQVQADNVTSLMYGWRSWGWEILVQKWVGKHHVLPPERQSWQGRKTRMKRIVQNDQAVWYKSLKWLYLHLSHLVWTPLKRLPKKKKKQAGHPNKQTFIWRP